jgi:hypothetical protein
MALDHLLAIVDGFPDATALAWARLDERCEAEKLEALADIGRTHGTGTKAAIEITTRVAQIQQQQDGAKLRGMVSVAAAIAGLVAPGSREDVRKVLTGLPPPMAT